MIDQSNSDGVNRDFKTMQEVGTNRIGVGKDGVWVIEINGLHYAISSIKNCWGLLPLLEGGRRDFITKLEKFKMTNGILSNFPELTIVKTAFSYSGSDYWIEKALSWIDEMDETDSSLNEFISSIEISKNWGQKLRHRIDKLKRRAQL